MPRIGKSRLVGSAALAALLAPGLASPAWAQVGGDDQPIAAHASPAPPPAGPEDLASLRQELKALRAEEAARARRIDELERRLDAAAVGAPAQRPVAEVQAEPPLSQTPVVPPPSEQPALVYADRRSTEPPVYGPDPSVAPEYWGEWQPGQGFTLARTPKGEFNVSAYMLVRYLNQLPGEQSFVDHLGRRRDIDTRNDFQVQRALLYLQGWVFDPKLNYNTTVWTVNATNQVAVIGYFNYRFNEKFQLWAGLGRVPGSRSMAVAIWPYIYGTDRNMAEEFFRPGFSSGVWATGELLPRVHYNVMTHNSITQIDVNATELTRDLGYSGSIWWMPTTGEFGRRGGMGDWEIHDKVATRFGISGTHSREDRFTSTTTDAPDNTQIKLSDSVLLFETGSLAPGVTVNKADFDLISADAGVKYDGWALHGEAYWRRLSNFEADGPLPLDEVNDAGFFLFGSKEVLPQKLQLYLGGSYVFGEFNDGWEIVGGANWYPFNDRNFRLNGQVIAVESSPFGSSFGYYVGGQDGATVSVAAEVLY